MGKLQKLTSAVSGLGAAGSVIAGAFVFSTEDGTLQQVKFGSLVVFDARRAAARRARRAERK
jgi:hypothetical protein